MFNIFLLKKNCKQQRKAERTFTYFPTVLDYELILQLSSNRQVYRAWKQTEHYLFSFAALQNQQPEQS